MPFPVEALLNSNPVRTHEQSDPASSRLPSHQSYGLAEIP
jgi:hypothetical protein